MPVAQDAIKIEGLNEFVRNLKKLDRDLPKAVRTAFNEAADLVAAEARPKVPSKTGRARGSVKSKSTQRYARVIGGSARVPYYPWLDFGGTVGKGKRGRGTGPVRRKFIKDTGRYIFKTWFDMPHGRVEEVMIDALVRVANLSGIEVEE